MTNLVAEILSHIERVAALRERYRMHRELACCPVNLDPVIAAMTTALDAARFAIVNDDAIASLHAYELLKGFSDG